MPWTIGRVYVAQANIGVVAHTHSINVVCRVPE